MTQTHFRSCHLCEAICGVAIEVEDGKISSIRGDKDDPFSRGYICPKAMGLKDIQEDPDRLKLPQRRVGDRWETIGWDEALDEAAEKIVGVQTKYGRNSVAIYQGNPSVHNYGTIIFGQSFTKALRTRNRYSATSVDQLPHMLASLLMFGHQLHLPIPDVDRTQHMLIIGANPVASNGSLMTAPGMQKRLKAIQARGGKVIVVDPRRTETAAMADEHLFIRPQTDAFLLAGMLHTLFIEKLFTQNRLFDFTDGLDRLKTLVARFPAERVSEIVGIPTERIKSLAREFAKAPSAICYGRVGVSTQEFGGVACWLINALNIVTGNLDREGGLLFTNPAVDVIGLTAKMGQRGHFAKYRSRVRNLPEFGGELPVAALAEEMDTPGKDQVRALVTSCGNPVLSTPNGRRLEQAIAGLDFMLSIDFYRNETTRHANLILPPTFALEHDHYDLIFNTFAVRNTAKYSLPLFDPQPGARHDWEILLGLSRRLDALNGARPKLRARAKELGLKMMKPSGMLELGLRIGPHGFRRGGMSLKRLRENPHGVDLGALAPSLPRRLFNKAGRIDLAPAILAADLERLEQRLASSAALSAVASIPPPIAGARDASSATSAPALQLIGRRELRSNNSWMHNSLRLVKGPKQCTLRMHPADASARALRTGSPVRIASRVGEVIAMLEISEEMMPGVVSLPHGWGHGRPGTQQRVASEHAGVSINDLTDEALLDELSGNASLCGVQVHVSAAPA